MENLDKIDIGSNYKELIKYFGNVGYSSCTNYTERNVFIQIRDKKGEQYLQVRLDYSRDTVGEYDYNNLQIAWKLLGVTSFSIPHKFPKDMNQKVIFNIILFEITNWRLQHLDEFIVKTIDKILNSDAITNWLKTKEEQIRIEEKAKIENHLSIEEFRKVVKEELGKISINLKIGDK